MDKNINSHLDVCLCLPVHLSLGLKAETESCGRTRVVGNTISSAKMSRRQNPAQSLSLFTVMTYATAPGQATDGRTVHENPGGMLILAVCALKGFPNSL